MKICILVVDCLRPDHLGCYGYPKNTSPGIDRIAADSVLCESVYAQCNWTYPSVYALLTGRYPTVLNVNWFDQRIHRAFQTLPERLSKVGYKSAIFSNFKVLLNRQGMCSHFDEVTDVRVDKNALSAFGRWAEKKENSFLFFHIGEYVHEPYYAPKDLVDQFLDDAARQNGAPDTELIRALTNPETSSNSLRKIFSTINRGLKPVSKFEIDRLFAHYDAGIRYVDGMVEQYYNMLRSCGDDYLFILLADHGQAFMEHNFFGHGLSLYDEVVKVPLIIDFKRQHRHRIKTDLQLADVYPTLLDCLGLEKDSDIDGVSFWNGMTGGNVGDRTILLEGYPNVAMVQNGRKLISAYSRHWSIKTVHAQFMRHQRTASWIRMIYSYLQRFRKAELFDLPSDPFERHNLAYENKDAYKKMHEEIGATLNRLLSKSKPAEKIVMDRDIENQLEKLGYL